MLLTTKTVLKSGIENLEVIKSIIGIIIIILLLELYTEIQFDDTFIVLSVVHPSTYLNKIVCGSQQGSLQLWNIRTKYVQYSIIFIYCIVNSQLIYVYSGWNSPVLTLVQSTALDIVGVGLQDGHVILHNVHLDESVMTFSQEWGPVTSLSFRTGIT